MNKLKSVLSTLPDPIFIVDTNMFIIYQNKKANLVTGDRFGERCFKVIGKHDTVCPDCPASKAFKDGKYRQVRRKTLAATGEPCHMEISASPIKDSQGEVSECAVVYRDITAAKETEAQKQDIFSMLSHDLKTPISLIHSYAELLLEKIKDMGEGEREMVERIKNLALNSSRLLDDFLTLSKIEAGKMALNPRPASLAEMASLYAEEFRVLASERSINIHTDIPRDLPKAVIDETHCGRVISNIIANAVKYCSDGGSVWVKAGIVQEDRKKVFLEVTDEGAGISESDLPHVTEKYYSGPSNRAHGTGLGLAIVKALTELHGGALEIKSREGVGTNVRVVLPTASSTQ